MTEIRERSSGIHSKFASDDIQRLTKDVIGNVIGVSPYSQNDVNKWTTAIVDQTMAQITKSPGYKFIVTCLVIQKTGSGLQIAASCFWDPTTDGSCTIRWENKTVNVIVQVFGLAI